jgi:penicillin-binding protein 1C
MTDDRRESRPRAKDDVRPKAKGQGPKDGSLSLLSRRRVAILAVVIAAAGAYIRMGPLPADLLEERPSTIVTDRRGVVLYEARAGDGTRGMRLSAGAIPPAIAAATLAAEDHRFLSHYGVDPIAIARAAKNNLLQLRVVEGGSTITQQLAKLLLARQNPDRHRGWGAKAREAVIALRLEHRFGKDELLAMYLNLAHFGNQISGVERASRAYFGTSASQLTAAQAAFLAGLPQRPSGFNPFRHRDAAVARQRAVLRRMETARTITAEQAREAREERLVFASTTSPFTAPHFVEMALAAAGDARPARLETTLDAALQADVTGIIEQHRPVLDRHGARNVAVVVLDNRSGEWLAWEGSGNYADAEHGGAINGPLVPRQPGSALKPFTYALAFEQGAVTPATALADVPSSFPTAEPGIVYRPRNYDGIFRGPLLARTALAGSENVPAVALAASLGVPPLLRFLERAGLTTLDRTASHYGVGLTLGNAEVRLDELVAAYAAFARQGEWIAPSFVATADHDPVRQPADHNPVRPTSALADHNPVSPTTERLVSPRTAFWITDILSDDDAREYVFGRGGSLEFPFQVAVKTGTSQSYHDNWTIGYSRHVTVGVWVGNFDRTPLRNSSGVTGAAPIFHAVMLAAERRIGGSVAPRDDLISTAPADLREREICALSGLAATTWCPTKRREWMPVEAVPHTCSWHHLSDEGVLTILPPEYDEWARGAGRRAGTDVVVQAAAGPAPAAARSGGGFAIVSPADGSTYSIDPTLRREFQTLPLRTIGAASGGRIEWSVDGRLLGSVDASQPRHWMLVPGEHRISARDARGRVASARVTVR